ncbi:CBO0543 family protein [Gracilibacillus massiliensis]|uniref:CBO0543 family protein n=1 Tax=Gracilibacillus massiliensis TaxID=1564956 RepID=UPI00071DA014|nr:CBO0543 family protein [Gracilibacillus massiliensis]
MILIFGCLILFNIIAFFMPKRLTKIEIYATALFATCFGFVVDILLDFKSNMYGFLTEGVSYLGVMAQLLIYPSINILFLNYFPFTKNTTAKTLYIVAWSVFSVVFEWISLQTSFFYYTTWKLWYSAVLYPILFLILLANLRIVRRIKE